MNSTKVIPRPGAGLIHDCAKLPVPTLSEPALSSMRIFPLTLAAALLAVAGQAWAQSAAPAPPASASASAAAATLQASPRLQALRPGDVAGPSLPTVLQAQRIQGQPDLGTVAEGDAEFRRGGLVVRADRLAYDAVQDLASAKGQVRISHHGALYSGPELQLRVQRFEGWFAQPTFEFTQLGAGGRAERIEFIDSSRSRAITAEYTSCPRDDTQTPAWVLRADRVSLDLETNEGVAEGATLRFLGLPILALATLSFPLSDNRRSGWLPPSFDTDNRSGIEISAPYYWNIAPNRDATFTPRLITRRGLGLNSEFRYLEPEMQGAVAVDWLPKDTMAGRSREAVQWQHEGSLSQLSTGLRYGAEVVRVSDDEWWKDFPSAGRSLTARLLPLRARLEKSFSVPHGEGLAYARVLRWQVLQDADAVVVSPYQRSPQVGVRLSGTTGLADRRPVHYSFETEYNRFTLPGDTAARADRTGGERWHAYGSFSWPWRDSGAFVVPRLSLNAASYGSRVLLPGALGNALDSSDRVSDRTTRVIPSFSVDSGLAFERQIQAFGRPVRQTLEPRVLYVNTPYRAQSQLPNYDAAAKDFNFASIYSDNQFSGIDRVSDSHQLTAGFTTRFVDANSGAEALRLGVVQRYLFRTQRVAAQSDGSPDGPPLEQRFSDALLLGSTNLVPNWTLDAAAQFNPEIRRSVRTIVGTRYSPGAFRTVSATYRLARGLSEQLELGWQWPIWKDALALTPAPADAGRKPGVVARGSGCQGTWYAVGRVNFSLRDTRVTDSVLGVEYDAGCWIGRVVAERQSTGSSQATTRYMFQLELVGLSRIGSNPLKVLKDNIPGYRLLREERRSASPLDDRPTDFQHD
jgi:LPS-assembly protein